MTHFEFPSSDLDKRRLIAKHERKGRQWVSTALVDGRMRMKFEKRHTAKVIPYSGHDNHGGRAEWDR